MSKIVGVRRDETGSIDQYKFDDGRILSRGETVAEAEAGLIDGVSAFTTRNGDKSVRSNRGISNYSLDDLPEF